MDECIVQFDNVINSKKHMWHFPKKKKNYAKTLKTLIKKYMRKVKGSSSNLPGLIEPWKITLHTLHIVFKIT